MSNRRRNKEKITMSVAKRIARKLNINFNNVKYKLSDFRKGMEVELEHGLISKSTNVTGDDPLLTGKIALAHLNESPLYYDALELMEEILDKFNYTDATNIIHSIKSMLQI